GRAVSAPTHPLLLIALAAQVSSELESMRLMRLVDLVTVVRRDTALGTLDWHALDAAIRRTQAANVLYPSLTLAENLAPGTIDPRVLRTIRDGVTWVVRRTTSGR